MAFRIRGDEPIVGGLVRIALEQIDRSLGEVADGQMPRLEAVHEARKRCKKLRGLLRLSRTALPDIYRSENAWFRDVSRPLAHARQGDANLLALEGLRAEGGVAISDEALERLRAALHSRHQESGEPADVEARLAEFAAAMREARGRVAKWPEHGPEPNDAEGPDMVAAMIDGARKTYRRGRRALETATEVQGDEYLHEFRKLAKYHWHHVKLLEMLRPKKMRRRARRLAELSDLLGDDRDLGALRQELLGLDRQAEVAGLADEIDCVVAALDRRRGSLRRRAFRLAGRLYAERPGAYAQRLEKRWKRTLASKE